MRTCIETGTIAVVSSIQRTLWLQASAGVTYAGVAPNILVSRWFDQSGNGHNFTQATDVKKFTYQPTGSPFIFPTVSMTAGGTNDNALMTSDDGLQIAPPYTLLMCCSGIQNPSSEQFVGVLGDFNASVVNNGITKQWNHYQPWQTGLNESSAEDFMGAGFLSFVITGIVVDPTGFCRSFHAGMTVGDLLTVGGDFGIAADTNSGISVLGCNGYPVGAGVATPTAFSGSIAELIIYPSDFGYDGTNWDPTQGLQAEVTRLQTTYG